MAAIGSIRKRSGLLIIAIGVAMVLFLLGDLFSGGAGWFSRQEVEVGEIAGKTVTQQEFEQRVQRIIDEQFGAEGTDERTKRAVRDRVWSEMVTERVYNAEFQKLGITVSPDELLNQVKNTTPGSVLYQYFSDPKTGQVLEQFRDQRGQLDGNKVLAAVQNILNSENADQWIPIENAIKEDIKRRKYTTLLTKGLVVNSVEAKQKLLEESLPVMGVTAVKEYSSIDDANISPTEADYKSYYEKHKHEKRFQNEWETRSVKLAIMNVEPSPEDLQALTEELEELKPLFAADTNDTVFVMENADGQVKSLIRLFTEDRLPPPIKDTIVKSQPGVVVGPYTLGNQMLISKLSDIRYSPDSVRASHILIQIEDGDTAKIAKAKTKLDSLRQVAQKQNNFADLAREFSDDLGSAEKGGDLDWFTRGRMVPEFEKAAFNAKVGEMPIVVSQFGVHLIHVTDKTKDKKRYLISSVDRVIEPGKATVDMAYKNISRFAIEHNTPDKFTEPGDGIVIEQVDGLRLGDNVVGPIGEAKEVVQWAFQAEPNEVSAPIELENRFVVVLLTRIIEEGTMDLEDAKPIIHAEVIRSIKASQIMSELGEKTTVEEAAQHFGTDIIPLDGILFSNDALPNKLGKEPRVVGVMHGLEVQQNSKPIEGNRGVYVVRTDHREEAPADLDVSAKRRELTDLLGNRVSPSVFETLEKIFGVKDKRSLYY
ncbi:MAG: SurA N-terminal domain-containing protein [Salibacteraceae bacterium]